MYSRVNGIGSLGDDGATGGSFWSGLVDALPKIATSVLDYRVQDMRNQLAVKQAKAEAQAAAAERAQVLAQQQASYFGTPAPGASGFSLSPTLLALIAVAGIGGAVLLARKA